MKNSSDEDRAFQPVDRSSHVFGKTELYLLMLLFVGGIALDSWFHSHPRSAGQSSIEQPSAHKTVQSFL